MKLTNGRKLARGFDFDTSNAVELTKIVLFDTTAGTSSISQVYGRNLLKSISSNGKLRQNFYVGRAPNDVGTRTIDLGTTRQKQVFGAPDAYLLKNKILHTNLARTKFYPVDPPE